MQRSAWLAIGATTGALIAQIGAPVLVQLAAAALLGASAALIARRRPAAAALAAGVTLILLRGALGTVAVPATQTDLATEGGSHEAVVLSIGTPGGGIQVGGQHHPTPGRRYVGDRLWS